MVQSCGNMNGNPPKPHCGVDPVQPAHRRAHASWHASWGSNKALYAMPVYESWPTHQVCLTFAIRNLPSTTKTDASLHNKRRSECGHSSRCMQLRRTPNKAHPHMLFAMHGQHSCVLSVPPQHIIGQSHNPSRYGPALQPLPLQLLCAVLRPVLAMQGGRVASVSSEVCSARGGMGQASRPKSTEWQFLCNSWATTK